MLWRMAVLQFILYITIKGKDIRGSYTKAMVLERWEKAKEETSEIG